MEFTTVDAATWDSLPVPTPPKPKDQYEPIFNELEQGKIVQITVADAKEMKGKRIGLGRKASAKGIRVEYRTEGNNLYVRKIEKVDTPIKQKKEKVTTK